MKCCVLTFDTRSGTGVQTITGVVDNTGVAFVGKVFLFQSAYAPLNTLTSGAAPINRYMDSRGVDTGTLRSALLAVDVYSGFNFKDGYGSLSLGDYSLIDTATTVQRTASITAIRSGEFDLTYATNARTGDAVLVLVLGGDDLTTAFTNTINGTYVTAAKPQGILALPVPTPAVSGGTSTSAGGHSVSWGFATRDGVYGTSVLNVVSQGDNFSAQRTTAWSSAIDPTTGVLGSLATIAAWGDLSFTIANGQAATIPLALCGDQVRTSGGRLVQPLTAGTQIFDTGIAAKVILFFSVGQVEATTVYSTSGQQVTGWATPTSQVGFWAGEREVGNTSPSYGARYLSNASVLRFGTPNGSSTTFHSVASVDSISQTTGQVALTWTSVDGVAREILWFAIGEAALIPPTPSYTTRTLIRRRVRRSPIVWEEKDGLQGRVRVNLFAVDMEPATATAATPAPVVMVRASQDSGHTWTDWRNVEAGRVGEYTRRMNTWRWGQARNWVFEVAVSDDVAFRLINAYIEAQGGTS